MAAKVNYSVEPLQKYFSIRMDEKLQKRITDFVMRRAKAIREGRRKEIDATYDPYGLERRDHLISIDEQENLAYYDWYLNRMERGCESEITAIHVTAIENPEMLPAIVRKKVAWDSFPDFELKIRTKQTEFSWLVRLDDDQVMVIVPPFTRPPWADVVVERTTRKRRTVFNAEKFTSELSDLLAAELWVWPKRLKGIARIRAFALSVTPNYGMMQLCLMTDRDPSEFLNEDRWALADWQFHDFAAGPNDDWPAGLKLSALIKAYTSGNAKTYVNPKFSFCMESKQDLEVLIACGQAMAAKTVRTAIKRFDLMPDFKTGVFHFNDETNECNFALKRNQNFGKWKAYS